MASRHSSAASHSRSSISAVSRGDTYLSETHCKLRRSAAVGQTSPHPLLVPQSGTKYHPQHHRGCVSPPSGNSFGGYHFYPQLRCFAACSGFHDIGPAPRNPQLIHQCNPRSLPFKPFPTHNVYLHRLKNTSQ